MKNPLSFINVLKLNLINKEEWKDGKGANYNITPGSPLITLIESDQVQPNKFPSFNLNCSNIYEMYEVMKKEGIKVGKINTWSSERNDHIDFDVYDPDENPVNLIECKSRTA